MSSFPRITTGAGDEGLTHLWSGERVKKTDPRIQAIGAIDLALSGLGKGHAYLKEFDGGDALRDLMLRIHQRCIQLMGELACSSEKLSKFLEEKEPISSEDIEWIEGEIEKARTVLGERGGGFAGWKLYGEGGPAAAEFYFIRGLFRQAEVRVLELSESEVEIRNELNVFMNRISDLMFLVALMLEE